MGAAKEEEEEVDKVLLLLLLLLVLGLRVLEVWLMLLWWEVAEDDNGTEAANGWGSNMDCEEEESPL